jgi:Uncharacterised nucleotidyltransferase
VEICTPLDVPVDRASCKLLCAVGRPARNAAQQIECLAQRVRDWDALVRLAEEHRITPMLFSQLGAGSGAPAVTQQRLREAFARNAFHSLANAAELIGLLKAFNNERIPAIPFKGVVLGASVYHDLTTRPAGDLDILVHYADLLRATAVLREKGYELQTKVRADGMPAIADYYEYHFERHTDGMVVELRWRLELTVPKFKRDLGMDWAWPRRRTTMLAGAEVPCMSPETTLLMLCMHGSKHAWSRLIWICDVARLLDSETGLDWQEVMREAKRSGLRRTLALGVLLAHRVTGAAVPPGVLRRLEADAAASNLAQYIEENLFDAPGSTPPGRVPYSIQLLDWPDRIRWLLSLEWMRPNGRDEAAVTLPKPLHPLYFVVRPFRILLDQSPR